MIGGVTPPPAADVRRPARELLAVALVTLGASAFAIGFRASLSALYEVVYGARTVVDAMQSLSPALRLGAPIAAALLAGLVVRLGGTSSQGVSNVMEAIALGRVRLSLRVTVTRALASWTAIAGGLSIGREGPLIEVGGALGSAVGRRLALPLSATRVVVAAGTAAGFAAAYNTPFAATLFVLETMAGVAAPVLLLPVMAATAGATAITRAIVGAGPLYGQRTFGLDAPVELVAFAVLGVGAALAASAFKAVLAACERGFERRPLRQPWRALVGGAAVGLVALVWPRVAGNGYEPLAELVDTPLPLVAVGSLAVAKIVATSLSVASGIPGGIFTPMMLVGAAIGSSAWLLLHGAGLAVSVHGTYVLVGMAAATAAAIHAPLTAAVMVFELSGDYPIVLPLLVTTLAATATSRLLGGVSVYDAELQKRGLGWELTLEGRQVTRRP